MGNDLRTLGRVLPLLRRTRYGIAPYVILGVIASAFEGFGIFMFIPLIALLGDRSSVSIEGMPDVIEPLLAELPPDGRIVIVVALILGSIIVKNAIVFGSRMMFASADATVAFELRRDLFEAVLRASPDFLRSQPSGRIANALFSETWRAKDALALVYNALISLCAIVILGVVLLVISWQMTLAVLPFLFGVAALMHLITRRTKHIATKAVQANAELTVRSWEALTGLATVRAFGAERYETDRFTKASVPVRDLFYRLQLMNESTTPVFEVLLSLLLAGWILALSATGVTLPTLAAFLVVLYRIQPRVRALIGARVKLMELAPSVGEIETLIAESRATRTVSGTLDPGPLRTAVEFRDVSVLYPDSTNAALRNVDARFEKGKTTAIVGRSGAGKTTIVQLLSRNVDPTGGEILVDGIPLPDLDVAAWRRKIAVVAQDVHLFSDTVRANIAYSRPDCRGEDVIRAAQLAHADDFIRALPQGYDTEIGEQGHRLSGGQRQRLALARALLREPEILILDEATNALDSHSETLIQEALAVVGKGTTVIMVAHRLATIRNADHIVMLDAGHVVERGDWSSLVALGGSFAAMVSVQAAGLAPEATVPPVATGEIGR